jgi:hypothetical protein
MMKTRTDDAVMVKRRFIDAENLLSDTYVAISNIA